MRPGIKILLVGLIISVRMVGAQVNLVPNASFEVYSTCPFNVAQINFASPWFQPYAGGSSTDYFNSCSSTSGIGVPQNIAGYQYAKSGNGYAGITLGRFNGTNIREYLEVELNSTLIASNKYCVSFYMSLSDKSQRATDAVGVKLSMNSIGYGGPPWGVFPQIPQIKNIPGNLLTDTVNWMLVVDTFISSGGEKFITLGNFTNDSLSNYVINNPNGTLADAYYYFDDISVVLCDSITSITSLDESGLIIKPNPVYNYVQIDISNYLKKDAIIKLYNSFGLLIMECNFNSFLNLSNLPSGGYFLFIETVNGKFTKKLVKQ